MTVTVQCDLNGNISVRIWCFFQYRVIPVGEFQSFIVFFITFIEL